MRTHKWWPRLTLSAVALAMTGACAGVGDRPAPPAEEVPRDIALAPEKDTVPAVFEDTTLTPEPDLAYEPEPVREPDPAPPPVRRDTPEPRTTVPDPAPVRDTVPVEPAPVVEPESPRNAVVELPAGTLLKLSLDEELSTRTSFQGDAFTATVTEPVYAVAGEVIVPAGASVRGRVTHVQTSSRVGETAVLNVAFEALILDGVSYPLTATVIQANPERVSRQSTGEQVGKVAAGAAAGAIIGRVLGSKGKDAIKGAVIGAAAGTAIALGTADVDAVLKAGSSMVIRTDQAVPITIVID